MKQQILQGKKERKRDRHSIPGRVYMAWHVATLCYFIKKKVNNSHKDIFKALRALFIPRKGYIKAFFANLKGLRIPT